MKNADHYFQMGLQDNLKDYPKAIEDYTKAIELNPDHYEAYLKRGTLRYKVLKEYREALTDFDKVIEMKPDCALAYLHRGIVKCHLLEFELALPDLNRALELDPNDERGYYNRGKNKYMLKYEEKEVRQDLEKAILFGSTAAADMLKLYYDSDPELIREKIIAGMNERKKRWGLN
ncbi:MAG: tetratricopeptide repeat protein [Acidobacteria bacterium]|jgi:tetratricopeptide (TPR) repeat protein|nr:tetratricopeptide repeat protein [Acidobacteriota bacterium]